MTDTGRDDDDIAGRELNDRPLGPAELHAGAAAGDAQHFVRLAMVVLERVDAVDPGVTPGMVREKRDDEGLGIAGAHQVNRAAVEQQRQARIVGDQAVIAELQHLD